MDDRTDGKLLTAWRAGDAGAFELLVGRYQAPLLRHARALLGTAGDDVVQEVFLRLAQSPPTLPDPSGDGTAGEAERASLAPWLHRVARNLCMDALRSETRRKQREEAVAPPEATAGGSSEVEANDTRAAVERSLAKLPADQREVLVLRLFGENSYKEIAAITGKKVGTIGWLISVGMQALATELAPLVSSSPSLESGVATSAPATPGGSS